MDRISELLDEIGWAPQSEPYGTSDFEWKKAAFKWMTEATNRIQELQYHVQALEAKLHRLDNKLDPEVEVEE